MKINNAIINKLEVDYKIPQEIIENIRALADENLADFGAALVNAGHISRNAMGNMIGSALNYSYVELSQTYIDNQLVNLLPKRKALEFGCIPLYQLGESITLALSEPENSNKLQEISFILQKPFSPVFAFPDEIKKYIALHCQSAEGDRENEYKKILTKFNNAAPLSDDEFKKLLDEKGIIHIVETLFYHAVRERASDIHLELYKEHLLVRFRIDGMMHNIMKIPTKLHAPIVSRLKLMANLDITEKRLPLDGKFIITVADNPIDIRISTVPGVFGEKVVLRILAIDNQLAKPSLSALGLTNSVLRDLQRALKKSNGMLFVTGPTGAGKTTTLYAMIEYIKKPEVNVVTIEDPVEYQIDNVTQIEINNSVGRDFSTVLRSVLRQDPDIILVGEIRDLETAKIAATAALTGHTVLTTLHTNNAIQAITRMVDMGVQNFVIAPSIIGVINQRLVRKICQYCCIAYQPTEIELMHFHLKDGMDVPAFYHGKGCERCSFTGYKGRIPLVEYIKVTAELRSCILNNASHEKIAQVARKTGYKDLRYDGFLKVLQGLTTLEEVMRVTTSPDIE